MGIKAFRAKVGSDQTPHPTTEVFEEADTYRRLSSLLAGDYNMTGIGPFGEQWERVSSGNGPVCVFVPTRQGKKDLQ